MVGHYGSEEREVVVSCPRCGGYVRAIIDLVGDPSVGMDPGSVDFDLADHDGCNLTMADSIVMEDAARSALEQEG